MENEHIVTLVDGRAFFNTLTNTLTFNDRDHIEVRYQKIPAWQAQHLYTLFLSMQSNGGQLSSTQLHELDAYLKFIKLYDKQAEKEYACTEAVVNEQLTGFHLFTIKLAIMMMVTREFEGKN